MSTSNTASSLGLTLGLTPPSSDTPNAPQAPAGPVRVAKPADKRGWWWGTGRRKTAVCRVRIKPGDGSILILGTAPREKPVEEYFCELRDRGDAVAALTATGLLGKVTVRAKCHGGGFMGQAGAMRLAIARALVNWDPALHKPLRDLGFLTRDSRAVERKKYGQPGARRRFQFSKR